MVYLYETDNKSIKEYMRYVPLEQAQKVGFMIDTSVYAIEEDDVPAGAVLVKQVKDTLVIKSIEADEDRDSISFYSEVISELSYIAHEQGCEYISAKVIPTRSSNLYRTLNAHNNTKKLEEVGYLEFKLGSVKNAKRLQVKSKSTIPLSYCFPNEIKEFMNRPGNVYADSNFDRSIYDEDVSCVFLENKKPAAVLLVRKIDDTTLGITRLISLAKDKTAILYLMAFSIKAAIKKYGKDTTVKTAVANERLTPILEIVLDLEIERREEITISLDFIRDM